MAIEYLTDGATTFAAGSWRTIADVAGSGFTNDAELIVPGGGASISAGLDQSASTSTGIRYLILAESYSGNVGDASSPLITEASDGSSAEWRSDNTEGRVEHNGTGTLFIKGDTNGINNLMQDGPGRTLLTDGTAAYVRVQRGIFQTTGAATVTNVSVMGGTANIVAKAPTNSAGTALNVHGGSVTIARPFTTINVYGGTLTINVYSAGAATTTINQYGGTVVLLAHGNNVITTYNHFGGTFDPSRLRVDTTITTYIRQFGATFTVRPNGAPLTLTNSYRKDPNIGPI
jgi:hypothetical protein